MLKETKYVDFMVNENSDEYIKYRILSIIPAKVQDFKIVDDEIECNYVDNYRIRYKLIVAGFESPISEVKTLTKFSHEIMEKIIEKAELKIPSKEEVAELTYV